MSEQVSFALRGRNPDVLTCIANLSNDEVFTPPEFANKMLDNLAETYACIGQPDSKSQAESILKNCAQWAHNRLVNFK